MVTSSPAFLKRCTCQRDKKQLLYHHKRTRPRIKKQDSYAPGLFLNNSVLAFTPETLRPRATRPQSTTSTDAHTPVGARHHSATDRVRVPSREIYQKVASGEELVYWHKWPIFRHWQKQASWEMKTQETTSTSFGVSMTF